MPVSFLEELHHLKSTAYAKFSKETIEDLLKITDQMAQESLKESTLRSGDVMPHFVLPNASGKLIQSVDLIHAGPLIVSFYRGGWCPFCSLELRFLEKIQNQVKKFGANIVAISPQTTEYSKQTQQNEELSFNILSDQDNFVAKSFGLIFPMIKQLANLYRLSFDLDLKAINGNEEYEFPVPATYIIRPDGVIHYDFIDADYTERLEPSVLLDQLAVLV